MLKVLSSIFGDLDPKVKVIGQKAGICDGLPSTSALVLILYGPVNNFSFISGLVFLRLTSTKQSCSRTQCNTSNQTLTCNPRSRVKHSTTKPLCPLFFSISLHDSTLYHVFTSRVE